MSSHSSIEWTEVTWNPVTGCVKISDGCKHCYAERMAGRLRAMGVEKYRRGFEVAVHENALKEPLGWKRPRLVFVNSMSDLFHEAVSAKFVESVFDVMNRAREHTFQVITKRPERVLRLGARLEWTPNVWLGRLDVLADTGARVKFLSLEPLLGPLPGIDFSGVDWVIVGGESGPGARPMEADWVRDIQDGCAEERGSLFLQAVGRGVQEAPGAGSRRQDVGPDTREVLFLGDKSRPRAVGPGFLKAVRPPVKRVSPVPFGIIKVCWRNREFPVQPP